MIRVDITNARMTRDISPYVDDVFPYLDLDYGSIVYQTLNRETGELFPTSIRMPINPQVQADIQKAIMPEEPQRRSLLQALTGLSKM